MKTGMLAMQMALGAFLFWSCFCRMTKTDRDTHREVRWAFLFKGACSGILAGAPLLPILMPREATWAPYTTPTWVWLTFLLSVAIVQVVTAHHWRDGVPREFQRGSAVRGWPGIGLAAVALALGTFMLAPVHAIAQKAEEDKWRKVDGDILHMEQGNEVKCMNETGCVVFTIEALQQVLKKAGGTCGKIPQLAPGARGT